MCAQLPMLVILYCLQLSDFVAEERMKSTIYPKPADVFSWTQACKLRDVKVVILGQDPYHGPNQAHGTHVLYTAGITKNPQSRF